MQPTTISEAMKRVGRVADRVGIDVLAAEAGLNESTVRSYRARGWTAESLTRAEMLIAAAKRLNKSRGAQRARPGR
jgi:hypothetical protein